jgi:Divergent InlB B-repeat domain
MHRWTLLRCMCLWLGLVLLVACSRTQTDAPSGVDVAVSANALTITWQDNSDSETGFAVDRKQGDADFAELIRLDPNTTTYTDTTAVAGQSYIYRVRALGLPTGDIASPESSPVTPEPVATVTLELLFAEDSTGLGTVSSTPQGLNCNLQEGSVCRASFPVGSTVTLTATPNETSSFASWSEGCEGTTPTCQVNLTENKTVRVRFVPVLNTLTVQKAGEGKGRVTSGTPPDIDCGKACVASYEGEVTFRLRATAEKGSSFAGWSDNCKLVGSLCEVKIGGGKGATVTATFSKIPPPVITAFAVDKTVAVVGSSVVFNWTVTGEQITSLVLKDDKSSTPDIPVTGLASYTLTNVQETATYTLVATNAFGGSTTSQPITVKVGTVPVLADLAAAPNEDGSFTLSWTASGSEPISYTLTDIVTGETATPTASPFVVRPTAFPVTYRLDASNEFGAAAAPLTVTLEPPVAARILSFTPSTTLLVFPGPVTLSWSVEGNEPLTLTLERDDTNEIIPLTGLTGSLEVTLEQSTKFKLEVQNAFSTDEDEVRVRVRRRN